MSRMRKHRSLSLVQAGGGRPSHRYEPYRPAGSAVIAMPASRSAGFPYFFFSVLLLWSIYMVMAEAVPAPSSADGGLVIRNSIDGVSRRTINNSGEVRRPLSRCPAIFNPATKDGQGWPRAKAAPPASPSSPCYYFLKERVGTLTTPGFPSAFPLPFFCRWIIDATSFEPDSFITLYLTQMYLTRGVKAVQYSFCNESHALGRKDLDELHTLRPRPFSVYRIKARYLEVQVNLDELVNANLRVEHRLMDVYGFNITYEIQPNDSRIRTDTCNVVNCTFNGHCYANHNYSQFQCSCLPGFFGKYCQYGPECNPEKGINVCKNGGICGYRTGLSIVRCSCPPNYNGSLCEFRRQFIPAKECLSGFRLNCSHHCILSDKGPACRCPPDQALRSDMLTCYPLVPLRVLGQVELSRPSAFNDSYWTEGVTTTLKKLVNERTASLFTVNSVQFIGANLTRFEFVLSNSENYIMTRDERTSPVVSALKNRISTTTTHRTTTAVPPRNEFTLLHIPYQWNSLYTSLTKQIPSTTWTIFENVVEVRGKITMSVVPPLLIEWVKLGSDGHVREGYPFIVACNANGTKKLKLEWYKDGHPVKAAFSLLRNMSIYVLQAQELRGFYTLYLEVKKASVADRGEYECRVTDLGQSVRQSIFVDVITPPVLDLIPINMAVLSGSAVNLTCRDENHLARRTSTKYIWLKNGRPLQSSCDEIIEDLTPVGSLLKITAIQRSTNYTCQGENGSAPANKTTHVFVVQPNCACPFQRSRGVEWPMTAVEVTNYQFCPNGYVGPVRRRCRSAGQVSNDPGSARQTDCVAGIWEEPDFSHCSDRYISELYKQMKMITLGYMVTDVESIVDKFSEFVKKKFTEIQFSKGSNTKLTKIEDIPLPYLAGEGNALLEMAKTFEIFMFKKAHLLPPTYWESTAIHYLYALDTLLSMPKDFFLPDGGIVILRLIQNHLVLLKGSSLADDAFGSVEFRQLKNCNITIGSIRKELKYKNSLASLPSLAGFKSMKQLAPAQFVLNGTNVTMNFRVVEQPLPGGEFLCALLHLQPTNHSRNLDLNSCSVERLPDPFDIRCHCSHQGTAVLIYAERESMELADVVLDLWIIIYFAASSSNLLLLISLVVLSARWYRRRTLWAWFQIQLGVSLLPSSSSFYMETKFVIGDPFLTIMLTMTTYLYVATLCSMMTHLKESCQKPGELVMDSSRTNHLKAVGLSLGTPLALSGVQTLLKEFSVGTTFVSWLFELSSISGIFFCLAYSTFMFVILVLYMSLRSATNGSDKINNCAQDNIYRVGYSVHHNYCCLALAGLSLIFTGSTLFRLDWLSLSAHCASSICHLLAVMIWATLMFSFSETGYVCAFWCVWQRSKMPNGETVSEMLNATALTESPQRTSLLSSEQQISDAGDATRNTRRCHGRIGHRNFDEGLNPKHPFRGKRLNRSCPASSPLLQRAGLGPDVLRAFGLEQSHSSTSMKSGRLVSSTEMDEPIDLMGVGRDRTNSATTSDGMQRDDVDSGFGPSGGGGSQKLTNGFDKFSDAWRFLSRIRWKLPQRMFSMSNGSNSGGGSFRSRQSTMSNATTVESAGDRGSSVMTEETEIPMRLAEEVESLMARRLQTRWTDDNILENEFVSQEVASMTIRGKPFRGRCFIRCSPEMKKMNIGDPHCNSLDPFETPLRETSCCERCWHNPETPYCNLCQMDHSRNLNEQGMIAVRAVIESSPNSLEEDVTDYLEMDPAGSFAIDQQQHKPSQVYYNLTQKRSNRNNKEEINSASSISPFLLRRKKILSGRIVKKYRHSLRSVAHSTQHNLREISVETSSTEHQTPRGLFNQTSHRQN